MGFSSDTGGNWFCKEKESKILHFEYVAYTPAPLVQKKIRQIHWPIDRDLKGEGKEIDS